MSADLPGLPPPRPTRLAVPDGGAAAARREGVRRRRRALLVVAAVVVPVAAAAASLPGTGTSPVDRLQVAFGGGQEDPPTPTGITGLLLDQAGRPLPRIAVLPADLSAVLTRTGPDGRFTLPCPADGDDLSLVLSSYAPARPGAIVRERSPGAADVAWRRVRATCGRPVRLELPPGGNVEGTGPAGQDVRLERVSGSTTQVAPDAPVFASRTDLDGRWRVGGLDTGRYLLQRTGLPGVIVDVREGQTTTLERQR